jgi:hypothetical protein
MGSSNLAHHPGTPPYYLSRNQGPKISGKYLHAVNSATVTLHPVIPNPYMLLGFVLNYAGKVFYLPRY